MKYICPVCEKGIMEYDGEGETGSLYKCTNCGIILEDEDDDEFHGDNIGYEWRRREDGDEPW